MPPRRPPILPTRAFLYTRDQIMTMFEIPDMRELNRMMYFEGRSQGAPPKDMLRAINIMPAGVKPEWRVPEDELIRWMRVKGFQSLLR